MKKLLFLTAAAAVAFSSCTKDQTEVASIESKDGVRISASMVESTRTYLGDDNLYRWSKGDALGVFVKSGVNNAKNVAFTLDPIYDGQVNGEFVSNNTDLLDAASEKFFAYYPHTPGMIAENVAALDLKVLPQQNYQPGSFATLTAPSVSDNFTLSEPVSMQPVADYLKVRINGVEDIEYLTLAIQSNGGWLNLTDVNLKEYGIYASNAATEPSSVRYALVPKSFATTTTETTTTQKITVIDGEWGVQKICGKNTGDGAGWDRNHYNPGHMHGESCYKAVKLTDGDYVITESTSVQELKNGVSMLTLNCGRLDETVVCHNENEYVFVVPAGILRSVSAGEVDVYLGVNTDLTEIKVENMGKTWFVFDMSADEVNGKSTGNVAEALRTGKSTIKLENYIHNVNGGEAITYNPTNKFIIHNELDFLQYMNEYGNLLGKVDAYVCGPMENARNNEVTALYEFDFSPEHINELATSFKGNTDDDEYEEKMNKYVSDYIARGIPCIGTYENAFEANGAIFEAIKGLQSANGMFGTLARGAKVENFILKNIKGAAKVEAPAHDYANAQGNMAYAILASSVADGASIENIDIENASYANCILAAGDVDDVEEIEIVANEVLPYVIYDFTLDQNWTVAPEKYLVNQLFVTTIAEDEEHNVITVAESADAKATYKMFGAISDDRDDDACVSVVINNESWWTNDIVADATVQDDYAQIAYAEQLKAGGDYAQIALTRNMQMNGFDWETAVEANKINGNGKTIYGIVWNLKDEALAERSEGVAPFAAKEIKKLNVEGQTFNFETDGTYKNNAVQIAMPTQIAGLTLDADVVEDVKINNFVIFAKDAADSAASLFDDVKPFYGFIDDAKEINNIPSIGWAVVKSTDGLFKNIEVNVTSSNVKGEAGLINTITLALNAESQVTNAKANVSAMEQTALNAIEAYDVEKHNNVAGTPVFKLINESGFARSIKFTECGAPALTYVAGVNSEINVLNGNALVGTFKKAE